MGNTMGNKKNKKSAAAVPVPAESQPTPVKESHPQKNGVVRRKKRGRKERKDRDLKGVSCPPDIGGKSEPPTAGAVPYKEHNTTMPNGNSTPESAPHVRIKLYRSYGDLDQKLKQYKPDYKVHRRSTNSLDRKEDRKNKSKSMPYSTPNYDLDNSHDSGNESAVGSLMNGSTIASDYYDGPQNGDSSMKSTAVSPNGRWSSTPVGGTPSVTPTSNKTMSSSISSKDGRRSCASNTSQSIPSVPESPMSNFDFPTMLEVKRKLELFEDTFRKSLLFKYQSQDEVFQLEKLAIAKTGVHGHDERIYSLTQYIQIPEQLPYDLVGHYYRLLIPAATYRLLQFIRTKRIQKENLWRSVALDIVDGLGMEVGRELSRMYEYQISCLGEDVSIQLLAAHATDCVMEYLTADNALMNRNSVLQAVVNVRPPKSVEMVTVFSVVAGGKEAKWELYDVLKKPGLRREIDDLDIHNSSNEEEGLSVSVHSPYPWGFYVTDKDCDPLLYGYRGQMLEWDYVADVYRLNAREERMYTEPKMYLTSDVHQHYVPYSHLVSAEKMQHYLDHLQNVPTFTDLSFAEFMRQYLRTIDKEDCGLLIYRPLSPLGRNVVWTKAILEDMDLTRLQMQNEKSFCKSFKNSRLLFSKVLHAHMHTPMADLEGADVSYSTWACYNGGGNRNVQACMVCVEDVDDTSRKTDPNEAMIVDKDGRTVTAGDDITRREALLDGELQLPQPDALVDYDYKTAERRSIHVLKTLEEDPADGGSSSKTSSIASGKRRKKRRKIISSASSTASRNSSGSENVVHSLDTGQNNRKPPLQGILKHRPQSAIPPQDQILTMDALQMLHQPPPTIPGLSYMGQPQLGKYKRRAISNTQVEVQRDTPIYQKPTSLSPEGTSSSQQSTEPRTHTYPTIHRIHHEGGRKKRCSADVMPLDPRDVLPAITDCAGAQYFNKQSNKKNYKLFGREDELIHVTGMVLTGTPNITITGCPGLGKSTFALAVAKCLKDREFIPVLVNGRGCHTWLRLAGRIMKQLGLHLPLQHVKMARSWLCATDAKIALIVDNVEMQENEETKIAEFLHELTKDLDNVNLLMTSRRPLYHPSFVTTYGLSSIKGVSAMALLRYHVPDIPVDTMQSLVTFSEHVPYILHLVSQGLRTGLVDSHQVMNALQNESTYVSESVAEKFRLSNEDSEITHKILSVTQTILQHLPKAHHDLVRELCVFESPIKLSTAKTILGAGDSELTNTMLSLLNEAPQFGIVEWDNNQETVYIPDVIRYTMEDNPSEALLQRCFDYSLEKIKLDCRTYHSRDSFTAVKNVAGHYDLLYDNLMDMSLRPDMYENVKMIGSQEMGMLLHECLEFTEFTQLYDKLYLQAQELGDIKSQFEIQCCLAFHHYDTGEYGSAMEAGELSERLLKDCESAGIQGVSKNFCYVCLGKIYWRTSENLTENKEKGFTYVRNALDTLKANHGLHNHLTMYAFEDYAIMEKEKEHYQKARYLYNVLDFIAEERLGSHPTRIRGYNSRREIWERQGLFCRASESAKKAAEASMKYYGEHIITANMYSHLCECLVKAGDANEAIKSCAISLGIREKLLGSNKDTALSNKMYAYLMLRGGHYDHALMYGQRAMEISKMLNSKPKYMKDLEMILKQAYKRQQATQSGYVKMETQKGQRVSCNPSNNGAVFNGNISSISTEV